MTNELEVASYPFLMICFPGNLLPSPDFCFRSIDSADPYVTFWQQQHSVTLIFFPNPNKSCKSHTNENKVDHGQPFINELEDHFKMDKLDLVSYIPAAFRSFRAYLQHHIHHARNPWSFFEYYQNAPDSIHTIMPLFWTSITLTYVLGLVTGNVSQIGQ
jgi:hypothetical protein